MYGSDTNGSVIVDGNGKSQVIWYVSTTGQTSNRNI